MTTQQPICDEEGNEEVRMPAILRSHSMIITDEEFQECEELQSITAVGPDKSGEVLGSESATDATEANDGQNHDAPVVEAVAQLEPSTETDAPTVETVEPKEDGAVNEAANSKEPEAGKTISSQSSVESKKPETSAEQIDGHKVKLPAVWTPKNARGHACFIYHFFRHVGIHRMCIHQQKPIPISFLF